MGNFIPDVQIGTVGGTLAWIGALVVIVIALFTTGLGPVVISALVILAAVVVLFFALKRVMYRLTRGK